MAFVDVALAVGTAVGADALGATAATVIGGGLVGAGVGAVGGGLYGALSGKSVLNNALGGAGIGALVGAGAGYAMAPAAAAVDGATISSTALPSTLASESAPALTSAAPTTAADLSGSSIASGQMNPLSSGMMNASTNPTSSLLSNLTPTGTSDLPAGTVFNNGTEMVGPNGSTYLQSDLQGIANQMGGSTAGQMGPTNAELGYTGPGTPSTNAAIQAANAGSKAAQPWYQMFADHPYMTAFGGLTLAQMMKEQGKYGVPTTTSINNAPPKNLNYAYNNATPMNLNRSYADGGSVDLNTSPIKQQLNGIATGSNDMFPQPGLHSNQYANPASTPVPGNVLSAPTDTPVDPYTGQQKMAAGGITRIKKYGGGGFLENLIALPINQIEAIANNPEQAALGINTPFEANVWNSVLGSHYQPLTNMYGVPTNAAMSGQVQQYAIGGATQSNTYAAGGNLGGYSDGGRMLKGPGDGMSDNIPASIGHKQPARLADSEFVIPADVVSHLGNGSSDAGAKKLYQMMDKVRMARTGTKKQGKQIKADKYMPKFADGGQVPNMQDITSNLLNQNTVANANVTKVDPIAAAAQAAQGTNQVAQNQNTVANAYATNLGRTADPSGGAYWNQQLNSGALNPNQVNNLIANSQEAQANATKAANPAAPINMTDQIAAYRNNMLQQYNPTTAFVKQQYETSLGRPSDASGQQFWASQIQNGTMTPDQVSNAIANSQEAGVYKSIQTANNTALEATPAYQTWQNAPITQQNFDSKAYLAANPDVAAAGVDPWTHYQQFGIKEGRTATKLPYQASTNSVPAATGGLGSVLRKRKR